MFHAEIREIEIQCHEGEETAMYATSSDNDSTTSARSARSNHRSGEGTGNTSGSASLRKRSPKGSLYTSGREALREANIACQRNQIRK
jgi:hypothetical protein